MDNATLAELKYATGAKKEAAGLDACVDLFYEAASHAYLALFAPGATMDAKTADRLRDVYNSSLTRLIGSGQIYGRLDAQKQIIVSTPNGPRAIPLVMRNGPWQIDDIDELLVVGDYEPENFTKRYGQEGLGVPVVAVRHRRNDGTRRDQHMMPKHPFALTVVLRPDTDSVAAGNEVVAAAEASSTGPALELYDPTRGTKIDVPGGQATLAAEVSAPLQYGEEETRRFRLDMLGFRQPASAARVAGLFFLEPYKPGKIPVVFVHGLLSDAHTWDEMLNELRADPGIRARYQFAVYMYPTGNPFLLSAASLRRELKEMRLVAEQADPALDDVVLVGHSMGGVLSRFQVTQSRDMVWQLVARRPFEQIIAPPPTRQMLQEAFFFEPEPFVKRVVFIGTPHRGSTLARSFVARIGAHLVTPPPEITRTREQLLSENPDAFNPLFARHMPTSVEDLASGSPILDVMQKLPFSGQVHLHSIIGRGKLFPVLQPGDGYVPISSAHLDGVESELFVDAEHTMVHRDAGSVSEVKRILRKHWAEAVNFAGP